MYNTKKIYFNKVTGEVVWEATYNYFVEPNLDRDYEQVRDLNQYEKNAIDLLVLHDGQLAQDFAECAGCRVNVEKLSNLPLDEKWKALEFIEPNQDNSVEPVYIVPLSEKVLKLESDNEKLKVESAEATLSIIEIWETLLS